MISEELVEKSYRKWGPMIYKRCYKILGNFEEAEDATQEVFVKILKRVNDLEDDGKFLNLLYKISTNHCLNLLRNRKPQINSEVFETSHKDFDLVENKDLIITLLSKFNEKISSVIYYRYIEGMTYDEISQITGYSRKTCSKFEKKFLKEAKNLIKNGIL